MRIIVFWCLYWGSLFFGQLPYREMERSVETPMLSSVWGYSSGPCAMQHSLVWACLGSGFWGLGTLEIM